METETNSSNVIVPSDADFERYAASARTALRHSNEARTDLIAALGITPDPKEAAALAAPLSYDYRCICKIVVTVGVHGWLTIDFSQNDRAVGRYECEFNGPIVGSGGVVWGSAALNYDLKWLIANKWRANANIVSGEVYVSVDFTGLHDERIGHFHGGGLSGCVGAGFGQGPFSNP